MSPEKLPAKEMVLVGEIIQGSIIEEGISHFNLYGNNKQ